MHNSPHHAIVYILRTRLSHAKIDSIPHFNLIAAIIRAQEVYRLRDRIFRSDLFPSRVPPTTRPKPEYATRSRSLLRLEEESLVGTCISVLLNDDDTILLAEFSYRFGG